MITLRQLDDLGTLFAAATDDQAAAERCWAAAAAFDRDNTILQLPPEQLVRKLVALADRLEAFDGSACKAAAAAPLQLGSPLALQVQAAIAALSRCARVAAKLPLRHGDVTRLAAASRLALHSGAAFAAAAAADLKSGQAVPAARMVNILHIFNHLSEIIHTATALLVMQPSGGEALNALYSTVLTPAPFAAWLATMADFVLEAGRRCPEGRLPEWVLPNFLGLLAQLSFPRCAQHGAALACDVGAVESLVSVLLDHTLPAYAAAAEGRPSSLQLHSECFTTLNGQRASPHPLNIVLGLIPVVVCALSAPCLAPAAGERVRRQGPAALQQVLRLAAALPTVTPAGVAPTLLGEGHATVVELLCVLCLAHSGQPCHLVEPDETRAVEITATFASSQGHVGEEQWQAAACEVLKALPRLLGTLRSLADGEAVPPKDLARISLFMRSLIIALFRPESAERRMDTLGSGDAVAAWAEAAAAGSGMLALLCQLDTAWQQQRDWMLYLRGAAGALALSLACTLGGNGAAGALRWGNGQRAQRGEQSAPSPLGVLPADLVWRLHSASCRAVHFLAADSNSALLQQNGAVLAHQLFQAFEGYAHVACLHFTLARLALQAAAELQAGSVAEHARRVYRAVCAAQVEAVRAAAAAQHVPLLHLDNSAAAIDSLVHAGAAFPALVDARFAELLGWAFARLPPAEQLGRAQKAERLSALADWVEPISGEEHLLAAVACNGMLRTLLVQLAAFADSGSAHVPGQCAFKLGSALALLANAVGQAAEAVAEGQTPAALPAGAAGAAGHSGGGEGSDVPTSIRRLWAGYRAAPEDAARLTQAAQRLVASLRELGVESAGLVMMTGQGTPLDLLSGMVQRWPQVLGPAQAFCELLLQHWAQPEQLAAARLELAQAAAARSCAYLRCANVGLEGGPAAGQGAGSKRCSGCRVAWYCGTACSHADWRQGGHRRVCTALAAARQAA